MRWDRFVDERGVERVRKVVEPADRLAWAKVPDAICEVVLRETGLQTTQAVTLASELALGKGKLLVLSGGAGRGKSIGAAYAVAHRATLAGALWVDAPSLARVVNEKFDDECVRRESLDERMAKVSLLVLDDVGMEHSPSGYAAGRILEAVTSRNHAGVPTILTTNLSAEQFAARYGPRVVSRIAGDGLGFHALVGPDLRRQR